MVFDAYTITLFLIGFVSFFLMKKISEGDWLRCEFKDRLLLFLAQLMLWILLACVFVGALFYGRLGWVSIW